MTNQGVAPLDPTTPVGQVRALLGDTNSVPLNPVIAGQGSYNMFSDADLGAFIVNANYSVTRAVGHAYTRIAGTLALQSANAKAQDMAVDISMRAEQFTKLAQQKYVQADEEDALGRNAANNMVIMINADPVAPTFSPWRTPLVEDFFSTYPIPAERIDGAFVAALGGVGSLPSSGSSVFNQPTPQLVWIMPTYGQYRTVVVVDVNGNPLFPDISITSSTITLTFTTPTAGAAILS